MIIPIKHTVDWELLRQKNHNQIHKYNIRENSKRVDHDYKIGDKVMLYNDDTYKY